MKKFLLSLVFVLSVMLSFAQSESIKPTFGVTLEREVAFALIEKEAFKDVVVELKAAEIAELFAEGVKVTVKDAMTGKKIFKKGFPSHISMPFPMEQYK